MMSQSPVETKEKDSKIIDENKSKFRIWYDEHIPADSYRSLYFAFIKWCIIAAVVGIGVGAAGALFGTPAAAAVFAVEVTIVGASQYSALVPCMLSGIIASMTAGALGAEAESFFVTNVPSFGSHSVTVLLAVIALGMICAVVSVLFCEVMHNAQKLYAKFIENPYIRVAVGGCIIVILTVLLGNRERPGFPGADSPACCAYWSSPAPQW